jgi:hypothetical protein
MFPWKENVFEIFPWSLYKVVPYVPLNNFNMKCFSIGEYLTKYTISNK